MEGLGVRVQHPIHYTEISEACQPGVCPLCTVLKDFQAVCIREADAQSVQALCNFHTWAFAGAAQAESAAKLFLRLLASAGLNHVPSAARICGVCHKIQEEESKRLDEFAKKLMQDKFREWMLCHGTVCVPHASKLLSRVPENLRDSVSKIFIRRTEELRAELKELLRNTEQGQRGHAGVLGRVAEVLAAQRGLEQDASVLQAGDPTTSKK
jgi:hypothetical protein